jgi:hypothetical protein
MNILKHIVTFAAAAILAAGAFTTANAADDIKIVKVAKDTNIELNGAVFKLSRFLRKTGDVENWQAVSGAGASSVYGQSAAPSGSALVTEQASCSWSAITRSARFPSRPAAASSTTRRRLAISGRLPLA